MDRRISKRIDVNFNAIFYFDDIMYAGTIYNLSVNGMFIKMDMGLYYYKPKFNVQLFLESGALNVPVKLSRFEESDGCYYSMGVELVDPPKQYLDFVASLESSLNLTRSEYQN